MGVEPEATARPAYNPGVLLKIYVYGILSSLARPSSRKPPSRKTAMPGKGVRGRRSHRVRDSRAFRPSWLAQRSISGTRRRRCPAGAESGLDRR